MKTRIPIGKPHAGALARILACIAIVLALAGCGRDQERVLPGLFWLREPALLDRILSALRKGGDLHLVEAP